MARFKPGQSGNPNGRPPLPEDLRRAKVMTSAQVQEILTELLHLPPEQLKARLNVDATMLEHIIGQLLVKAAEGGDHHRLNFLFDRIVGKVKEQVEITSPEPFIIMRRDGSEIVMGVKKKDEEKE